MRCIFSRTFRFSFIGFFETQFPSEQNTSSQENLRPGRATTTRAPPPVKHSHTLQRSSVLRVPTTAPQHPSTTHTRTTMGTRTYPERTVSSERTRTTKKKVTPPFSHLAVAATLAALSFMVSFPSQVTAETMNTLNTMDDASDMLADFAKYEMEDSTVDLVNAETGAKLSKNSKAAFGDATPFDDADDFDLGTRRRARASQLRVALFHVSRVTVRTDCGDCLSIHRPRLTFFA